MNMLWMPAVVAFVVAFFVLFLLLRGKVLGAVVDQPNHRSLHAVPTPRTGGLGLMAGVLAGWGLIWQPWQLPVAGSVVMLMAISFLDDVRGLSAGWRFFMHFVLAGLFCWLMMGSGYEWLITVGMVVAIVWMTNLYNFMDGSDGLAGGMALFGFGAYAIVAWLAGDGELALACVVIVASAAAFLVYNFHPARIFMGDAGSIPLGFLSGAMGLLGWQRGLWPLWFPVLVFSPFVADATVTLLKRLLRGEKIWQAHRSHYYQRLVQMGWGHRKTALVEYALMASVAGLAIAVREAKPLTQSLALVMVGCVYFVLMVGVDVAWRAQAKK